MFALQHPVPSTFSAFRAFSGAKVTLLGTPHRQDRRENLLRVPEGISVSPSGLGWALKHHRPLGPISAGQDGSSLPTIGLTCHTELCITGHFITTKTLFSFISYQYLALQESYLLSLPPKQATFQLTLTLAACDHNMGLICNKNTSFPGKAINKGDLISVLRRGQ